MRDLKADLEICNKATKGPWVFDKYDVDIWSQPNLWRVANVRLYADMQFIAAAREGWPHAIERAINAEAEVEQLKEEAHQDIEWLYKEYVLEADVNLSQDAIDLKRKLRDMVCKELQAENALLHKVVEAAREFVSSTGCDPKECGKCDPKYIGFCRWSGIGQALAELEGGRED